MIIANFLNSSEVTTDRLFQWDIGQKIQILNIGASTTPTVHFCNKKSTNALVVESIGDSTFNIPNTLLTEEYDITAFIYIGDNTEAKTIKVIHIPVTKRTKPTTYTYTADEDVIDFMAISAEIHSLLDGLVVIPYDNTKTYKKPNIVYYMGQTYICKSDAEITGVLPTDDTKWGLMCKNGANISTITFSNDTLHFKLETDDIIDVPLNTLTLTTSDDSIEDIVGLNIRKDKNGVLKIGDIIIPQTKKLNISTPYKYQTNFYVFDNVIDSIKTGDILEVRLTFSDNSLIKHSIFQGFYDELLIGETITKRMRFYPIQNYTNIETLDISFDTEGNHWDVDLYTGSTTSLTRMSKGITSLEIYKIIQ